MRSKVFNINQLKFVRAYKIPLAMTHCEQKGYRQKKGAFEEGPKNMCGFFYVWFAPARNCVLNLILYAMMGHMHNKYTNILKRRHRRE